MDKAQQKNVWKKIGFYTLLIALACLRGLATHVFIVPNAFAPGGIGGISSVIYNLVGEFNLELANTWFRPSVTMFIMNLPLVILSFFILNKEFAINSTVCVLGYTGSMFLFEQIGFPVFQGSGLESGVVMLASIAGGVLSGVALGGMLLMNASAGGTDIIGKIGYKLHPEMNAQWQIFAFDSIVVLFSGVMGLLNIKGNDANQIFINVATPILYSFISLFLTSEVADVITNGFHSSLVFNIITDKDQEIAAEIIKQLGRGATIMKGEGVFTHHERHIIVCVVKKRQSTQLKQLVKAMDKDAFLYITKAKEVNGFGFRSGN